MCELCVNGAHALAHTPSERLFVRIRQERCNCVESFVFAVAERARAHTHTAQMDGIRTLGFEYPTRSVSLDSCVHERVLANKSYLCAGCRLPSRLLVFASTATLFRSVCIHSMGDGIVIEYLFRIIHHHDILFRFCCGSDGNGGDGGDGVDFQYHKIMIFAFDLLSIHFYFISFYSRLTNERRRMPIKRKPPKSEFRITR